MKRHNVLVVALFMLESVKRMCVEAVGPQILIFRAGTMPSFLPYLTIPELCSILDTRYLRCKCRAYNLS